MTMTIRPTRVHAVDEVLSASNMNGHISGPIDDLSGDTSVIGVRDSLALPQGRFYMGLPRGKTVQRPLAPPVGAERYNVDLGYPEYWTGTSWVPRSNASQVTYPNLSARSLVGTAADQLAQGDHEHTITTGVVSDSSSTLSATHIYNWFQGTDRSQTPTARADCKVRLPDMRAGDGATVIIWTSGFGHRYSYVLGVGSRQIGGSGSGGLTSRAGANTPGNPYGPDDDRYYVTRARAYTFIQPTDGIYELYATVTLQSWNAVDSGLTIRLMAYYRQQS